MVKFTQQLKLNFLGLNPDWDTSQPVILYKRLSARNYECLAYNTHSTEYVLNKSL